MPDVAEVHSSAETVYDWREKPLLNLLQAPSMLLLTPVSDAVDEAVELAESCLRTLRACISSTAFPAPPRPMW